MNNWATKYQSKFQVGYTLAGILYLRRTVDHLLGQSVGNAFLLLLMSQFHLLFYAGRLLPNTLALPLVAVAFALWMENKATPAISILTFTAVSFAL